MAKPLEEYDFGLTYIKATQNLATHPEALILGAAAHARDSRRWRYYEIETNHMVASNRPQELAGLLTEIAGTEGR